MDLRFTEEEQAFRREVRAFIDAELPRATRERLAAGLGPTKAMTVDWQRRLNARGWAVPHWPVAWGGQPWSAIKRYILSEEMQAAPAPAPLGFNVAMCGPVVIAFGTEAQKKRFLPRMANLDDWWCQGFSEPGAGSDLASLKTRAVRQGDHYVVNGQKTWTTSAQHADWMFLLARTDPDNPKAQEGISFLLLDMKTPGITVRPIVTIDGGREVNEVFFDDVRVPAEHLVGTEHRGWDCAKFLLSNERTGQARVGASKERLRRLREVARTTPGDGGVPLADNPRFRTRFAEIEVQLKALEMTTLRVLADENRALKERKPNPASSVLKIRGTEIQQAISELYVMAAGPYGLAAAAADADTDALPDWMALAQGTYFNWRKQSIYGGSNEIQKNIMAKAFMGL
ncbi:MAG: acyl-CoA dehydrogenase family protein [Burkholderiales bacterium]|nr:acyl-CoA dehydrogenase family protein [Burkholderiales bacterium]